MTLPSIEDLKAQAKRLRSAMSGQSDTGISHAKALELIARQYGYRDWNTLHAAVGNRPKTVLSLGDRVGGTYLRQPFAGEVVGLAPVGPSGHMRVTILFDDPVDVVTFDSFSAFRSRVTCTIDDTGTTAAKTSDGEPHMRVRHQI